MTTFSEHGYVNAELQCSGDKMSIEFLGNIFLYGVKYKCNVIFLIVLFFTYSK